MAKFFHFSLKDLTKNKQKQWLRLKYFYQRFNINMKYCNHRNEFFTEIKSLQNFK